jgi:hypothetical protein
MIQIRSNVLRNVHWTTRISTNISPRITGLSPPGMPVILQAHRNNSGKLGQKLQLFLNASPTIEQFHRLDA